MNDRILIVEKLDHMVGSIVKKAHLAIWQVFRKLEEAPGGQKSLKFELLTHFESEKGYRPILQDIADRFVAVMTPFDRTWIYDFARSNKQTMDAKLAPVFRPVLSYVNDKQDFKSIVTNGDKLYIFMTSKRPNIDNKGSNWNPKVTSSGVDTGRIIVRNS